jgi:hypothetical protein
MENGEILDIASRAGANVGLVAIIIAIWKKIFVPGWALEQKEQENDELKELLNAHATRTEARVDFLEQERDKRYGPPA